MGRLGDSVDANLAAVFRQRLQGKTMIAVLDSLLDPVYITRVWTIFEQFTAQELGITVHIVMPPEQEAELERAVERDGGEANEANSVQPVGVPCRCQSG